MNGDDRLIGQLEDYLDEFHGETPLPAHVRDAIRTALPGTRQVPSRPGPWRVPTMISRLSTPARIGVAAAALVVAVALGAAVMTNRPGDVAAPTAASSPTPAATGAASPSAAPSMALLAPLHAAPAAPCFEGGSPDCIEPGTYAFTGTADEWPDTVSVELPAGWFAWSPGMGVEGILVDSGPDAPGGSGWGIVVSTVGQVARDPCAGVDNSLPADEVDTPEELAAAMAAWPGFEASAAEPITLDGMPGVRVQLSTTDDIGACPAPVLWLTSQGSQVDGYPMAPADPGLHPGTLRILDVGGELMVIRTMETTHVSPYEASQGVAPDPERHADDLVALRAIIESIQFGERDPAP